MMKAAPVDWNGGGDICGNRKWLFATKAKATGAPSGSNRTERSDGEGWSHARETRPPQWKSTALKKKRVQLRIFVPVLSHLYLRVFFSALKLISPFFCYITLHNVTNVTKKPSFCLIIT
ncbi:hypothetical protein ACTHOQ_17350 [Solibacillus silvestris]|uniref:hypothetical protein n=1 Tax=Solibacillus silvestris TaxID=76853 RepID=UPI003F7D09E2